MKVFFSENISGNLHDATMWINKRLMKSHPNAEVVTMWSDGFHAIVVWRIEEEDNAVADGVSCDERGESDGQSSCHKDS